MQPTQPDPAAAGPDAPGPVAAGPDPTDGDAVWLMPEEPPAETLAAGPREPVPGRRRPVGAAVGLLALGAVVGAVAVTTLSSHSSPQATAATAPPAATGNAPGAPAPGRGGGGFGGGFGDRGFGGGVAGEQRLSGTLAAVGSSTISVRTVSGTQTYAVTGTTRIIRDGAPAALSQLQVGDPVLLHVYPSSSGGRMLVERILAGTFGGGRFGSGDGDRGFSGQGSFGGAVQG